MERLGDRKNLRAMLVTICNALDSKAKVEQAVLIVERWLIGQRRHRFSTA
jgi:hypothetical protein